MKNQLMNVTNVRYIRFHPTKWHIRACVRIELYGCKGKTFCTLLQKLINPYHIRFLTRLHKIAVETLFFIVSSAATGSSLYSFMMSIFFFF